MKKKGWCGIFSLVKQKNKPIRLPAPTSSIWIFDWLKRTTDHAVQPIADNHVASVVTFWPIVELIVEHVTHFDSIINNWRTNRSKPPWQVKTVLTANSTYLGWFFEKEKKPPIFSLPLLDTLEMTRFSGGSHLGSN